MAEDPRMIKKQQTSTRGIVTRTCNNIKAELEKATVINADSLEDYIAQLNSKEQKLTELDNKVLKLLTTDAELDDELEQIEEYSEKLVLWRSRATRWIQRNRTATEKQAAKAGSSTSIDSDETQLETGSRTGNNNANRTIRLPKLEIKKFDGTISQWLTFWGQYEGAIHLQSSMEDTDKFQYLKSYLTGAAAKAIENLAITESNYTTAIDILKSRFGRKDILVSAHLNNFLKMTPVLKSSDVVGLRHLHDSCRIEIRSLDSLGHLNTNYGQLLAHIVGGLLPIDLLEQYTRDKSEDELWKIDELMKFLNNEIQCRERALAVHRSSSQQLKSVSSNNSQDKSIGQTRSHYQSQGHKISFNKPSYPSAVSLNTAVNNYSSACVFCESQNHPFYQCNDVSISDKRGIVIQKRLCFLCMKPGHQAGQCRGKIQSCRHCNRKHHQSVCEANSNQTKTNPKTVQGSTNNVQNPPTATLATIAQESDSGEVLLQTVPANLENGLGKNTRVRCVLDGASHRSFIKETLSRELNLEVLGTEGIDIYPFSHAQPIHVERKKVKLVLSNVNTGQRVEIIALETPEICGAKFKIPGEEVRAEMENRKLDLADSLKNQGGASATKLDILIGANYFWKVATTELERLGDRLMALNTVLGWTVMGASEASEQGSQVVVNSVSVMHIAVGSEDDLLSSQVQTFWNLESIGINDSEHTKTLQRENSLKTFEREVRFQEGRYEVALPWKENKELLGNNYYQAKRRTLNLVQKLKTNPPSFKAYDDVIHEQLQTGIIERVDSNSNKAQGTLYYIPHHGVIKEDRLTTKLRIVNDASSHEANTPSLNDCLEPGFNLMPELFKILVRFRQHRVAFTGDVEKAFHQIGIREEDRDALRFLWIEGLSGPQSENLVTYRFKRVPFGCTCSPFLLAATIKHHVKKFEQKFPNAARVLSEDLYVDDLLGGEASANEANKLIGETTEILEKANMKLRIWRSNSMEVRKIWSEVSNNDQGQVVFPSPAPLKVLGLLWDEVSDLFMFDVSGLLQFLANRKITKRWVLKAVARIFDPLGLVSPFTIRAKMLLQELWESKLPWDKEIKEGEEGLFREKFNNWCEELPFLEQIKIPRYYLVNEPGNMKPKLELHGFTDASKKAYAVVVYIRSEYPNGQVDTALVASKTRVAPLNELSLPRLELMGAVLGARLMNNLSETLAYPTSAVHLWTDSTIVLHWIRGSAAKWKPFVSNRVRDIQKLVDPSCWQHCAGKENPADLPTRGKTLKELNESSLWWQGPPWLQNETELEHNLDLLDIDENQIKTELRAKFENSCLVLGEGESTPQPLLELKNYSSLVLVLRTTAWIKRFLKNLRLKEKISGTLKAEELNEAEMYWVGVAQNESYPNELNQLKLGKVISKTSNILTLSPLLDENGLMCVGGRIDAAKLNYRERHPWILSPKHKLSELITDQCHIRLKHAGVNETLTEIREQYWIPKIRPLVKQEVQKCPRCKRFRTRASSTIMAPLPEARINPSPPFSVCGIDFAGPMYTNQGKKCYIALFTCAVTRGVHLELVSDLTTDKFLLAFRRFIARRGMVRIIYSDNAKTFKRAEADLNSLLDNLRHPQVADYFSTLRISWRYIAERAAWWGGFWERMVRSVKSSLKKTLGQAHLAYEELETLLIEVEATVNSRPISFVYQEAGEPAPLTPAHFLIGKRLTALPSRVYSNYEVINPQREELTKRLKYRQALLDRFWVRWKNDYLLELRSAHHRPNCATTQSLKRNDVVLIEEIKTPRLMWKIGVIEETMEGRDGIIRSCMVRLPNGTRLRRPIQLLYNLEI